MDMVKATMFTLTNYDSLAKQTAHNVIPYSRIDASVNNRMAGFIFYSIIKVFNLGQQFYTQNDQNAICPCRPNRKPIRNWYGWSARAQRRVAPMQPRKRRPRAPERRNAAAGAHLTADPRALSHGPLSNITSSSNEVS